MFVLGNVNSYIEEIVITRMKCLRTFHLKSENITYYLKGKDRATCYNVSCDLPRNKSYRGKTSCTKHRSVQQRSLKRQYRKYVTIL